MEVDQKGRNPGISKQGRFSLSVSVPKIYLIQYTYGFNSLTQSNVAVILKMLFLRTFDLLMVRVFAVEFPSCECHCNLVIGSQH